MATGGYSFIDIAVMDTVRDRFAAGDALVLLDTALEAILWVNGAGAALAGLDDLEAAIGAPSGLSPVARRQIMAVSGFPAIGENRNILVRPGGNWGQGVLAFRASALRLPNGANAILLAQPAPEGGNPATRIVAGLDRPGRQAALCDEDGAVIGATPGYTAAAPAPATLSRLIEESAAETDRLVKRLVEAGQRTIGIGIARLADNPARHLVILVDDNPAILAPETAAGEQRRPALGAERKSPAVAAPEPSEPPLDGWYFDRVTTPVDPGESVSPERIRPVADLASTPVRFTWRTDEAGCFTMVSPEFATAVGVGAADIGGRTFADVARTFNLDPDGEIAGLLSRRDTWSGRSLLWPIAGTDLKAPVDLAALPTYSRDRVFEGFRGFGIVRLADAVVDPEAIGLALISPASPAASDEPEPRPHGASRDPFLGETPALAISPTPERRMPDKIIRLAERRPQVAAPGDRALSAVEREAFREIGERLRQDEKSGAVDEESPPAAAAETDPGIWPADDGAETVSVGEGLQAWDEQIPIPVAPEPAADEPGMDGFWPEEMAADLEVAGTIEDLHGWDGEIPEPAGEPVLPVLPEKGSAAGLLSRLPLPMLVHSGDRLHFVNDEFLAATGYDSLDDLVQAGGIGALIAGPYPASDSEPPRRRPVRLVDKAGDEHPVEAHLQTIPWEEGRALLLSLRPAPITIVADAARNAPSHSDLPSVAPAPVSAPVPPPAPADAETGMAARVAELEAVLDTATDGILTLSADGTVRGVSRAAQALFGFDAADVIGKPFTVLLATESQRTAKEYLAGLIDNGVASVLNDGREVIGRAAAGGFMPLFMTIGRLPGDDAFCAVLRDISQWKRAEEELNQARRQAEAASSQKSGFLARVSHEIRTPLNAIIGFSELMLDDKFGPIGSDRYKDYLRDINSSGNLVLDLVNDLLDLSKIEAGQQDMAFEAVRLNETLEEAVSLMQPQANREKVIIRSSFAADLPEVVADLRAIKQIALNLLSNAVRFTDPGGQVIVSTAHESNGEVALRVRDTGVGMSRTDLEQAMKPFRQINVGKRPRGDGTGLGLPLTKALVEANRARFQITSTPGEGTMVEIVFPPTRVLAG